MLMIFCLDRTIYLFYIPSLISNMIYISELVQSISGGRIFYGSPMVISFCL
jgi:hypothetical protein